MIYNLIPLQAKVATLTVPIFKVIMPDTVNNKEATLGTLTFNITYTITTKLVLEDTIELPIFFPLCTANLTSNDFSLNSLISSYEECLLETKLILGHSLTGNGLSYYEVPLNTITDLPSNFSEYSMDTSVSILQLYFFETLYNKYFEKQLILYSFNGVTVKIVFNVEQIYGYVIPYSPDRGSYTEKYSIKTNIFTSTFGVERRTTANEYPFKESSYSLTLTNADHVNHLKNLILHSKIGTILQPMWTMAKYIETDLIDINYINMDSEFVFSYVPENRQYLCIIAPDGTYNTYTVDTNMDEGIEKYITETVSIQKGSWAVPCFLGYFKDRGYSYTVTNVAKFKITIEEVNRND